LKIPVLLSNMNLQVIRQFTLRRQQDKFQWLHLLALVPVLVVGEATGLSDAAEGRLADEPAEFKI